MSDQNFTGSTEPSLYTPTSDEKTMAILSHCLPIFFSFLAPLIIYLIKKDDSHYVAQHAKESLNFQLTLVIAYIVCIPLILILVGILLMWVIAIASLILCIIATINAADNKIYRYPFTLRLIK
ncbi:MAG: DUF4870 domain-containing protein [Gemmatimonadaceae bacterium]|nr:DUF4870 domain-containing protein [Chitinophagaceae bacterium]